MKAKPRRPGPHKFEQAIRAADNVVIYRWHPEYVPIEFLNETESYWPSDEVLEYMNRRPGHLPPIVVSPGREPGTYDIIDGHHRYAAAKALEYPGMWAVVVEEGRYT